VKPGYPTSGRELHAGGTSSVGIHPPFPDDYALTTAAQTSRAQHSFSNALSCRCPVQLHADERM